MLNHFINCYKRKQHDCNCTYKNIHLRKSTKKHSGKKSKSTKKSNRCPPYYLNIGTDTLGNTVCNNMIPNNEFPKKVLMNNNGLYAHQYNETNPSNFCKSKKVGNYITCDLTTNKKSQLISKNIEIVPIN
jgi:hypothetical protein